MDNCSPGKVKVYFRFILKYRPKAKYALICIYSWGQQPAGLLLKKKKKKKFTGDIVNS